MPELCSLNGAQAGTTDRPKPATILVTSAPPPSSPNKVMAVHFAIGGRSVSCRPAMELGPSPVRSHCEIDRQTAARHPDHNAQTRLTADPDQTGVDHQDRLGSDGLQVSGEEIDHGIDVA